MKTAETFSDDTYQRLEYRKNQISEYMDNIKDSIFGYNNTFTEFITDENGNISEELLEKTIDEMVEIISSMDFIPYREKLLYPCDKSVKSSEEFYRSFLYCAMQTAYSVNQDYDEKIVRHNFYRYSYDGNAPKTFKHIIDSAEKCADIFKGSLLTEDYFNYAKETGKFVDSGSYSEYINSVRKNDVIDYLEMEALQFYWQNHAVKSYACGVYEFLPLERIQQIFDNQFYIWSCQYRDLVSGEEFFPPVIPEYENALRKRLSYLNCFGKPLKYADTLSGDIYKKDSKYETSISLTQKRLSTIKNILSEGFFYAEEIGTVEWEEALSRISETLNDDLLKIGIALGNPFENKWYQQKYGKYEWFTDLEDVYNRLVEKIMCSASDNMFLKVKNPIVKTEEEFISSKNECNKKILEYIVNPQKFVENYRIVREEFFNLKVNPIEFPEKIEMMVYTFMKKYGMSAISADGSYRRVANALKSSEKSINLGVGRAIKHDVSDKQGGAE